MQVVVSTDSAVPIYKQIAVQARAEILSGGLPDGSALPSLRQLSAELRVSVITVTRAYNDLVAEGLVRNEHGRGFVVLAVDAAVAASALDERVELALRELVLAARHAGLDLDAARLRLEQVWRKHE